MSLVNDMLRDLEQRNKKTGELTGASTEVKAAQTVETPRPEPNSSFRYILWAVGVAALGTTLWLLWQDNLKPSSGPKVAPVKVESAEPKAVAKEKVETPKPPEVISPVPGLATQAVTIDSMQWLDEGQAGDLVVTLSGDANVQLVSQDARSITFALEGVQLDQALPTVESPLIKRLDLYRDKDRAELTVIAESKSLFAMRVSRAPTVLEVSIKPEPEVAVVVEEPLVIPIAAVEAKTETIKAPEIQTQPKAQELVEQEIEDPKPVTKVQRKQSDAQMVSKAQTLLNQGKLQDAVSVLQKRLAEQPENSLESRNYLATILISAGLNGQAETLISESLIMHSEAHGLKKLQARLWLSAGKTEQTVDLLAKQQPEVSEDPEYFELLATAYQYTGAYDLSAQTYYELLSHKNSEPRWWIGMAYALELGKRRSEALSAYKNAVKIPGIGASLKTYADQRISALAGG